MNKLALFFSFTIFVSALQSCGETEPTIPVKHQQDIDSLLAAHPDSVPLLLERGRDMITNMNYEVAMSDAAKAFRLDSNNIEVRELYAEVLNNKPNRSVADISTAQRNYKLVLAKKPTDTKTMIGLAATYSQQQDFETSFKYINEALRIDPKYRDAYVLKGSNYKWLGDKEKTKSSYETAVQQDPDFFEAYIMLGSLYEAEGNEICIQYYTTALQLKPDDLDATYALAFAKDNFNDFDGAKELYRIMAMDTADYYVSRGLFHQARIKQFNEENSIDSAIYFYTSAIKTNPMYVEAWYNLGLCHKSNNDKTQALKSFSKTLQYARQFNYDEEFIKQVEEMAEKTR